MGGWLCASQLLSYYVVCASLDRSLIFPVTHHQCVNLGVWGATPAKELAVSFSARRTSLNQVRIDRHDGPSDLPRPGPFHLFMWPEFNGDTVLRAA